MSTSYEDLCSPVGLLRAEQLDYWHALANELYASLRELAGIANTCALDQADTGIDGPDPRAVIERAYALLVKAEGRS